MVQENEKKSRRPIWIIVGVIVIGILATLAIIGNQMEDEIDLECCENICAQFNQECRGWNYELLECTFSYERYNYAGVEQVFQFKINDSVKYEFCNSEINIDENQSIEFGDQAEATIQ